MLISQHNPAVVSLRKHCTSAYYVDIFFVFFGWGGVGWGGIGGQSCIVVIILIIN
jgi:hypothetical protein